MLAAPTNPLNYGIDLLPIYYYYLNSKLINGIVYRATYRLFVAFINKSTCCVCVCWVYKSSSAAVSVVAIVNKHMIVSLCFSLFSLISLIVSRGKHSKLHTTQSTHATISATPTTFKSQSRIEWVLEPVYYERDIECVVCFVFECCECISPKTTKPNGYPIMNKRRAYNVIAFEQQYATSSTSPSPSSSSSNERPSRHYYYYYYLSCSLCVARRNAINLVFSS